MYNKYLIFNIHKYYVTEIPIVNKTIPIVGFVHVTKDKPIIAKTGTNRPIPPKSFRTFVRDSLPDWIILSLIMLDKIFKIKLAI